MEFSSNYAVRNAMEQSRLDPYRREGRGYIQPAAQKGIKNGQMCVLEMTNDQYAAGAGDDHVGCLENSMVGTK